MCRQKLKIFCSTLLLSSLLVLSGALSRNASAFSFGSTRNILFDPGYGNSFITVYNGNSSGQGVGPYYNVPLTLSADVNFMTANTNNIDPGVGGNLTAVQFALNDTLAANSLFTFSVRYLTNSYAMPIEYRGQVGGNFILLNSSCNTIAETTDSAGVDFTSGYTCTYWGYNSSNLTYLTINPSVYFQVPMIVQTSRKLNVVQLVTESGGGGSSGLTQADKEWLQNQIQQVVTSNNSGNTAINNVASEIEEMNERAEAEREEMEDNQDDLSDSAEDSAAEAESTGQTLLAAFTGFVNAIANADATNCTIPGNLGHFNMGNLNLCRDNPPALVQTIGSIFMILFFVPLSYATATKVISLFRSFQS